jgi:hypothetical protein
MTSVGGLSPLTMISDFEENFEAMMICLLMRYFSPAPPEFGSANVSTSLWTVCDGWDKTSGRCTFSLASSIPNASSRQ